MGPLANNNGGKEVENAQLAYPESQYPTKLTTIELNGDEFWPLSGRPFFTMVVTKSTIKPQYQLCVPAKLHSILPSLKNIPTYVTYNGKEWEMAYRGELPYKKRISSGWKTFCIDNKLKIDDACVFELMECSIQVLRFRVQILRSDIPSQYEDNAIGESVDTPVIID